jgi:GNAT superfamily N-acetyltransferase
MNLWSEYFKEREGYETFETDKGLASFKVNGDDCYIRDVFILPAFRHTGEASHIADQITKIAKERGCKTISGSIVPSLKGASGSLLGLLKYGFKLKSSHEDFIFLVKEI